MAKHRPHVIKALRTFVQHIVFHHGAHHASRSFWSQGEVLAVQTVFKGVHLLFDDIGHFAQAAHKQSRGFDDGRAQIAISEPLHEVAHCVL